MSAFSWIAIFVATGAGVYSLAVSVRTGKLLPALLGLLCFGLAGLNLAMILGAFK